ncbi:MAG TPA: DUF1800 domain-containing protein [Candidatus Limnocylindrales bacterium]|nr:DUF1800 domain-containing protein [Candidatus Limnocylindrales bacterium]
MSARHFSKLSLPVKRARVWSFARALLACFLSCSTFLSLGVDLPTASAAEKKSKQDPILKGLPIADLTTEEAILHALNRLAYGPRPGDIERIKQMGLAKWIDQQLNPNSIGDSAVEARLEIYPTLKMHSAQLLAEYPNPKQAAKQELKAQNQNSNQQPGATAPEVIARDMQSNPARQDPVEQTGRGADAGITAVTQEMDSSSSGTATTGSNKAASSADTPSPMKLNPPTRGASQRDPLGVDPNAVPRAISDDSKRPQRVIEELAMAKTLRAVCSERQLQQVMDDFWFNHFNVFAGKGEVKWYLTSYERDVIQPHAFGKFRELVTATAQSPAMLFYLDNFLSADPNAGRRLAAERATRQQMRRRPYGYPPRPKPQTGENKKQQRGLNENYGRELMELHTLGVDGGYTQKDVTEVARAFTGWTIEKPREFPQFKFDERLHDPDPKIVLGKKIHAGGIKDGEEVIALFAKNPNTARFISTKLARRFVSDTPPPALVDRMSKTFQKSDGDIREVLRTMIYSPEFWSRDAVRAKVKTPFELVVSSVRALGTEVDTPMPLVGWVGRIGEPLYQCQPPTGYSDKAETWVNTGSLLNRLNFSLALAGNKVRGSRSDVNALLGAESSSNPKAALDRAVQVFLGGQAAPNTVDTLQKQLENPQVLQAKLDDPVKQVDLGVVTGLVLGAPEFQRR